MDKKLSKLVRVRFAPSPTGSMHVGGIRTALYNFLFAKRHRGKFILRVEDTDVTRSSEKNTEEQMQDLKWLGLEWDEGPDIGGDYGPYHQSKRSELYQNIVMDLLDQGKAYYCFLTDDEIAAQKEVAESKNLPYQITSPYRDWSLVKAKKELEKGVKPTIRFKVDTDERNYHFKDLVRGDITLPSHMVGDFVLMRSGGMPVYNFCCVVDDHFMEISHVFRGEEHLPNTLRQLMLYDALSWVPPEFGHLSIILDENKKKLSKRHNAASCNDLKQSGYVPVAILNYLALLGWSHPRGEEILSRADLIETFSIDRVHASAAVFDLPKLNWLNGQHLRRFDTDSLWSLCKPILDQEKGFKASSDPKWYIKAIPVVLSEFETVNQGASCLKKWFNFSKLKFDKDAKEVLKSEKAQPVIKAWHAALEKCSDYLDEVQYKSILEEVKTKAGVKGRDLFMPLRVAMIGAIHGPDLSLLASSLPVSELVNRAQEALKHV